MAASRSWEHRCCVCSQFHQQRCCCLGAVFLSERPSWPEWRRAKYCLKPAAGQLCAKRVMIKITQQILDKPSVQSCRHRTLTTLQRGSPLERQQYYCAFLTEIACAPRVSMAAACSNAPRPQCAAVPLPTLICHQQRRADRRGGERCH